MWDLSHLPAGAKGREGAGADEYSGFRRVLVDIVCCSYIRGLGVVDDLK